MRHPLFGFALFLAIVLAETASAAGYLAGAVYSHAFSVSADGNVMVGTVAAATGLGVGTQHAFRWMRTNGTSDLGSLGGTHSSANGVSADGSVVVGTSRLAGDSSEPAFRWAL